MVDHTGRWVRNINTGAEFPWTPALHEKPNMQLLPEDYMPRALREQENSPEARMLRSYNELLRAHNSLKAQFEALNKAIEASGLDNDEVNAILLLAESIDPEIPLIMKDPMEMTDAKELRSYALEKYGITLDGRKSVGQLQEAILAHQAALDAAAKAEQGDS